MPGASVTTTDVPRYRLVSLGQSHPRWELPPCTAIRVVPSALCADPVGSAHTLGRPVLFGPHGPWGVEWRPPPSAGRAEAQRWGPAVGAQLAGVGLIGPQPCCHGQALSLVDGGGTGPRAGEQRELSPLSDCVGVLGVCAGPSEGWWGMQVSSAGCGVPRAEAAGPRPGGPGVPVTESAAESCGLTNHARPGPGGPGAESGDITPRLQWEAPEVLPGVCV